MRLTVADTKTWVRPQAYQSATTQHTFCLPTRVMPFALTPKSADVAKHLGKFKGAQLCDGLP